MLKPKIRLERRINKILTMIRNLPHHQDKNLTAKDTDRIYKVICTQALESTGELLRNNTYQFKLENDDAPDT